MSEEPLHPELEALADYDAGALDPAAMAAVGAHAQGCPACREVLHALARVKDDLVALPAEPIPAAVAGRLDRALAAAAGSASRPGDVVPLEGRRRRAPTWLAGAAAASVVALLGAALAVGALRDGDADRPPTATGLQGDPRTEAVGEPRVLRTGADYAPATMAAQVGTLLALPAGAAVDSATTGGSGGATATGAAPAPHSGATSEAERKLSLLGELSEPARLAQCLVRALGEPGAALPTPVAVDLASFRGSPAVIAVLPSDVAGRLDVYVLAPTCPEGLFLHFARIPAPRR